MKGSDVSVCRSEANGNRAQNEVCKKKCGIPDILLGCSLCLVHSLAMQNWVREAFSGIHASI